MSNFLGTPIHLDQEMPFSCQQCGDCCSDRRGSPIIVSGPDAYNIARALGYKKIDDLLFKKRKIGIALDRQTQAPLMILRTRMNGSCIFLHKRRCGIHNSSPIVCRLFPLSRIYNDKTQSFSYYWPKHNACRGCGLSSSLNIESWISARGIVDFDVAEATYFKYYSACAVHHMSMTDSDEKRRFFLAIVNVLFLNYNLTQPYLPQLEKNYEQLKCDFGIKEAKYDY